ncbi:MULTISPECIES: hypothetical protein [unclassified Neisseria]|uniref:hypothetical protein n=1 Tax=unclassified Neisseria TaxID=2623750 RepID=UPI002664F86D|nr:MULTISPECIES: hypothetical protein [unclassified Neisseria]MDO1509938.1 hypothetical protein [Neisseria sp. MVDL19-042950]MDO1516137.1 hypothetical protein [Neisseria sp. MVDL18-041461]MDO1563252.1 hypothetical protein [Neisseria sp. MVDL20-010259]
MRKMFYLASLCFALSACGGDSGSNAPVQTAEAESLSESKPEPISPAHYYSLKDGLEYGYEQVISHDAANQGQAANHVLMLRYSGSKDGKHQLFNSENGLSQVIECEGDCSFIKMMIFSGGQMLKKEVIKGGNHSIAALALEDAKNGKLEQYIHESKGKKYHVWFTDKGRKLEEIK